MDLLVVTFCGLPAPAQLTISRRALIVIVALTEGFILLVWDR